MSIRVACIGGGPGGLFFATLLKRQRPDIEVVLFERNQPDDAFGFGVVFSDRTLEAIHAADPALRTVLDESGVHWDSIAVSVKGETFGFGGNGMAAVHRKVLLRRLQDSARDAGVDLRFGHHVGSVAELDDFDLIVAADGTNSRTRDELEPAFQSTVDVAVAKFIWFGTPQPFDGLTFLHRKGAHGNFAAHAYPIGSGLSTFIVETDEATWRRAGLDGFDMSTPPGSSDEVTQAYLEELFANDLGGAGLVGNNSRWANFRTRRTERWSAGNVVLLGDAAHTAHFSVGSGTKMAMEDAIVLADEVAAASDDLAAAISRYEERRHPDVARVQNAAGPSLSWWEHFAYYYEHLSPLDFAFHFFARSIDIGRIRRRDPELAAQVDAAWRVRHGSAPLDTPLVVGDARLEGRLLRVEGDSGRRRLVDETGAVLDLGADLVEVDAPHDEHLAPDVALPAGAVVLVSGGTPVSRSVVAERARLGGGRISILVEDGIDRSAAETLILSGRADAVARTEAADDLA